MQNHPNSLGANWIGVLLALLVMGGAAVLCWHLWVNSQREVQTVDKDESRNLSEGLD